LSEERVRSSFAKQGLMRTLGATLEHVSLGKVEIAIQPNPTISQQHGFTHAGALLTATIMSVQNRDGVSD
jgi:acyl-coenzyme A thioesterase PaaI-like protein